MKSRDELQQEGAQQGSQPQDAPHPCQAKVIYYELAVLRASALSADSGPLGK